MFPTDSFFFSNLINNISYTILQQIGLDTNKMWEANNVIRERVMQCPLFMKSLDLQHINELKEAFNDFIDDCIEEVLKRII